MRAAFSLLILLCAVTALAQFDMTNPMAMMARPAQALMRPEIRKELKTTKEQNQALGKIQSDMVKASQGARGNNPNGLGDIMKQMSDADAAAVAVLNPDQQARLTQLRVQILGPAAILDPELGKPLNLTDDQREKAKQIQSDHFNAVMGEMQHHHDSGMQKRINKMRDEADAKMLDVLTDDQKAKFKEMEGPIFKNARLPGM